MEDLELLQEFKNLETSSAFVSRSYQKIQEKYPNKFIAVENNKIILAGPNVEDMINELRSMNKDPSRILIEFIPEKGLIVLY